MALYRLQGSPTFAIFVNRSADESNPKSGAVQPAAVIVRETGTKGAVNPMRDSVVISRKNTPKPPAAVLHDLEVKQAVHAELTMCRVRVISEDPVGAAADKVTVSGLQPAEGLAHPPGICVLVRYTSAGGISLRAVQQKDQAELAHVFARTGTGASGPQARAREIRRQTRALISQIARVWAAEAPGR